ncbi:PepSY domain-containing protein [Algiphilus aromaticivorans]|uniref:PepSY domain-containing protein n=1 Tax=Algiphilus aromaticivorans TaxID=382454 RepID=UPI0005C1338C|nr:PepSY domain-containing protein [Algiphilus aromaticivorans]
MADSSLEISNSSDSALATSDTRFNGVLPQLIREWRQRRAAKTQTSAQRNSLAAFLRKWHKRAGVFAFAFMIWLGASGFLINQSAEWGYDTARIDWPALMSLYGLKASPPREGFVAGNHWLAEGGDTLFLDSKPVDFSISKPRGMVASSASGQQLLYVAGRESLLLLTTDGSVYDRLTPPILPLRTIQEMGTVNGDVVAIRGETESYQSPDGGMSWEPIAPAEVRWSGPSELSEAQRDALAPYSRPSLPAERALLDLHSGQIFGEAGVWIVNIVGILSIWLGISGIWMTLRMQRQMKRRAKA